MVLMLGGKQWPETAGDEHTTDHSTLLKAKGVDNHLLEFQQSCLHSEGAFMNVEHLWVSNIEGLVPPVDVRISKYPNCQLPQQS